MFILLIFTSSVLLVERFIQEGGKDGAIGDEGRSMDGDCDCDVLRERLGGLHYNDLKECPVVEVGLLEPEKRRKPKCFGAAGRYPRGLWRWGIGV